MKKQAEEKRLCLPNNTQYQRLVQKISNSMSKAKMSPISPKNKLLGQVQSFGASGTAINFERKRSTTLGDFSVPDPWETGNECFRFATRQARQQRKDSQGPKTVRLKSINKIKETSENDQASITSAQESN